MTLEAILTVLTVILAVIALIPPERGQDLRIRLGGVAAVFASTATGLILYWGLLEPVHSLPWIRELPRVVPWLDGWDPASSSLAIVLIVTGACWWAYGRQIPQGRLPRLAMVLAGTLARRRLGESTHLLEAHLGALREGLEGNSWRSRWRRRLLPTPSELITDAVLARRARIQVAKDADSPAPQPADVELIESGPPLRGWPERGRLARWLATWAERPNVAAQDIARSISLAPDLIRVIATSHPYLGLYLSQLPSSWLTREFVEGYARALVADSESVLYHELKRARNVDSSNVPIVDSVEQPLLMSLCRDAVEPDGPRFLYTFLFAGINALRGPEGKPLVDALNQPIGDYHERTRWSSPPFATIYMLEVTAPRNAVSQEAHNLNLYVLDQLVDALLEVLNPADDVDLTREWPTPIHYLLYEAVSLLVDTVEVWQKDPSALPQHRLTDSEEGRPEILAAHAVEVLGSVMARILRSGKIQVKFKKYLLEVWWNAYRDKYSPPWSQSDTVLAALVRGGGEWFTDDAHHAALEEALEHVDPILRSSDGAKAMRKGLGLP